MALTPWKNLWELRFPTLREEMDKLFEDFFDKTGFTGVREGAWLPAADIHETKKDVVVSVDLPGVDPKDVTISIVEDTLTVKGERKREEEINETDYYRTERFYGAFQRVIQLPVEVVGDKAKATYKDGVLKISIPKSQKAMPKEIKVEIE
ncbi:MAG: Hsp20/alpha crystallin family protein [Syntrophorhabdaceae bacterium]|nr:Hsp20/alpha crystallin family protein [Syntrophorhabdales bacterium]MBP9560997.1 Hsp20/alpha crystallin family protein [Syntrophorhabdaceae bacterium]